MENFNSIKIDVHYFNAQPNTNITFNRFNYPQFMWVSTSSYMAISKKKIVLSDVRNNKILAIIVSILL